jgi:hypothetical protein
VLISLAKVTIGPSFVRRLNAGRIAGEDLKTLVDMLAESPLETFPKEIHREGLISVIDKVLIPSIRSHLIYTPGSKDYAAPLTPLNMLSYMRLLNVPATMERAKQLTSNLKDFREA